MSRKPYLVVDDHESRNYKHRLSWYIPEDSDIGGSLGEFKYTEADLLTVDPDDVDAVLAYLAISRMDGIQTDYGGFFWESHSAAASALRIAKAAIKAGADRPMPDWAQKALAAGWKAPKGWKP